MVESLPADAGDTGSGPGSGRIPRAAERLGPWATIAGPAPLEIGRACRERVSSPV